MGNCLKKKDENDFFELLKSRDCEIASLQVYIESLQLQIQYLTTSKSEVHDKYYDQLDYQQKILKENSNLRGMLLSRNSLNNSDK
tara:strand:+ start:1036 stop:1290 length:255 start_codon:yes stop_codon:yes gene_type:complete